MLVPSRVTALKEPVSLALIPSPVTTFSAEEMSRQGVFRQNALSGMVPGLHIPEYGASLTSTIYIRGLGSRMENPVMGLYIDGIPILDKNAYDFDWSGIKSLTMLRGPQGTLYGRNSMGGVLNIKTLSPSDKEGASGILEYGTANTLKAVASATFGNHSVSGVFRHTDGYFRNEYKGKPCDPYDGLSVRWKWEKTPRERLWLENIMTANASNEGGFAYGKIENDSRLPVSYNGESGYSRVTFLEGLKARLSGDSFIIDINSSIQILSDDMKMDQDYTPRSIFTLRQRQDSGAGTLEAMLRPSVTTGSWTPLSGVFTFLRGQKIAAPVDFLRDGIETLILDNANRNIPASIGQLEIADDHFTVDSDFKILTWGAAVYHESIFTAGKWSLTAGLRLDYEGAMMDYDCLASILYRFVPVMKSEKPFSLPYSGRIGHSRLQVLPKLTAMVEVSDGLSVYSTISRGSRAGGFNTQIFSDILQNMMMNGLMSDLGVYLDRPIVSVNADNTEYMPETAWNYELGSRFAKGNLRAEANLYRMDVTNQQLTVFPPGMSTGRMMTNAGKSRSSGLETELEWRHGKFHTRASYSFCDARFVEYNDGNDDYSGQRLPYIPEHTIYLSAGQGIPIGKKTLHVEAGAKGAGPIRWNENGTFYEPLRLAFDAGISMSFGKVELYIRGTNLTDIRNNVFYFKSMGNEFLALSKPRILTAGIILKQTQK